MDSNKDMQNDVMDQHSYGASVPRNRFDFQMRKQTEAIQEACSKLCDVLSEMNDSSLPARAHDLYTAYRQGYLDGFTNGVEHVANGIKNLADSEEDKDGEKS